MYTLGVAGGFGHDASACLLADGELLAFAEEERLSRNKLAYRLAPVRAASYCLREAGIPASAVDSVAFAWTPDDDPELTVMAEVAQAFLHAPALRQLASAQIDFLPHHDCHAAMAMAAGGYANGAVLVMDGRGERHSTTIYRADGLDLTPVLRIGAIDSLGSFYSAATRFAGFGRGGEGKLMGLAAYGDPTRIEPIIGFRLHDEGLIAAFRADRAAGGPTALHRQARPGWFELFSGVTGGPRAAVAAESDPFDLLAPDDRLPPRPWPDFAMAVQQELERAIGHLATLAGRLTGAESLALAGGVALNCSANGSLRRRLGPALSLHALVGDAGTSIGAAALHQHRRGIAVRPVAHAYLGPRWSDDELKACLEKLGCAWTEPADLAATVAERVGDGAVAGWFQDAAEAGPRALGHRSIIADPAFPGIARRINALKRREAWRPFAPSIRPDEAQRLFRTCDAPYMLEAAQAGPAAQATLAEVIHRDGTSRLHIPQPQTSPRYLRLLNEMGAVLNTSFNIGPEPIVCTPVDAVRSFFGSSLDLLAIGPFLVEKGAARMRAR